MTSLLLNAIALSGAAIFLIIVLVIFAIIFVPMFIYVVLLIKFQSDKKAKAIIEYILTTDFCTIEEIKQNTNLAEADILKRLIRYSLLSVNELKIYKIEYVEGSITEIKCIKKKTAEEIEKERIASLKGMDKIRFDLQNVGFSIDKEYLVQKDKNSNVISAMFFDDKQKKIAIVNRNQIKRTILYSSILSFEIFEDGEQKVKGNAGKTLIGWEFFGLGGALVGSAFGKKIQNTCTSLQLHIHINDLISPNEILYFVSEKIDKTNEIYKSSMSTLKDICATLEYVLAQKSAPQNDNKTIVEDLNNDTKTKLKQLKDLLDDGLITQQEFEQKKKQLFGL